MKYYIKADFCAMKRHKFSLEPFAFVLQIFVPPGQIPLQYAAIEKDVAAHANTKSPHENCVLQSCSGEIKPSSREQVIENH